MAVTVQWVTIEYTDHTRHNGLGRFEKIPLPEFVSTMPSGMKEMARRANDLWLIVGTTNHHTDYSKAG